MHSSREVQPASMLGKSLASRLSVSLNWRANSRHASSSILYSEASGDKEPRAIATGGSGVPACSASCIRGSAVRSTHRSWTQVMHLEHNLMSACARRKRLLGERNMPWPIWKARLQKKLVFDGISLGSQSLLCACFDCRIALSFHCFGPALHQLTCLVGLVLCNCHSGLCGRQLPFSS